MLYGGVSKTSAHCSLVVLLGENFELCLQAHSWGNVLSSVQSHFVNASAWGTALPCALIIWVQPPYTVTGLPPAGLGMRTIPYSTEGKFALSWAMAQKPQTCMAVSPRPSGRSEERRVGKGGRGR